MIQMILTARMITNNLRNIRKLRAPKPVEDAEFSKQHNSSSNIK